MSDLLEKARRWLIERLGGEVPPPTLTVDECQRLINSISGLNSVARGDSDAEKVWRSVYGTDMPPARPHWLGWPNGRLPNE